MTDADYWRDVQKRMAAAGAYDHGVLDAHLVDPPEPDAWDECAVCRRCNQTSEVRTAFHVSLWMHAHEEQHRQLDQLANGPLLDVGTG